MVVSVFAACMSVHAVPSRLYDCGARNDTMGYTASVCTADDAFTTARGAFCSGGIEACSRSCPATGFVVMKNRVVLVPSLLAGLPILSCLLLKALGLYEDLKRVIFAD